MKDYPIVTIEKKTLQFMMRNAPRAQVFWEALKSISRQRGILYNRVGAKGHPKGPALKSWLDAEGNLLQQNFDQERRVG